MRAVLFQIQIITFVIASMIDAQAAACENAVELSKKEAAFLISKAETALASGDAKKALQMLNKQLRDGYELENSKLRSQLERIWAVARMRAGGTGEIDDAIEVLRGQLKKDSNDPWLKVRLAEALSRTPKGNAEAQQLLEDLAKRDLIVDPEGYATLARLRKQANDVTGATQALDRCKAMAKRAAICTDTPLPPPAKTARNVRTRNGWISLDAEF